MTAINAWAQKCEPGDARTADQRRADAIVDICAASLDMPGLPRRHGARPTLNITVAASTLAGLDDQPAELDGYGPIPAPMARKWAADPTATRHYWPVDPAGRILDQSLTGTKLATAGYVPPASLARHVIVRDQFCTVPGCRRRARSCDLDHRTPWPTGPTTAENLGALCRHHHRMKHAPGWHVTKQPDGTHVWTSPTRHTYRYRPPALPTPEPPAHIDTEPPPF
jgi:hypothetical protein